MLTGMMITTFSPLVPFPVRRESLLAPAARPVPFADPLAFLRMVALSLSQMDRGWAQVGGQASGNAGDAGNSGSSGNAGDAGNSGSAGSSGSAGGGGGAGGDNNNGGISTEEGVSPEDVAAAERYRARRRMEAENPVAGNRGEGLDLEGSTAELAERARAEEREAAESNRKSDP